MRLIVMGLNITICSPEEKFAKKEALLDYLSKHIKVKSQTHHHGLVFIQSRFWRKINKEGNFIDDDDWFIVFIAS